MARDHNPPGAGEEKPFLEHLEDLRFLIWKVLVSWAAAALLAFLAAGRMMDLVRWPLARMARIL